MITSDQLNFLIEKSKNQRTVGRAQFLNEAITDWPKQNLEEPMDLILELNQEFGVELNYKKLFTYLKSLNPLLDPWKVESLSSILKLFDTNHSRLHEDLESIIRSFSNEYNSISNS